MRGTDLQRLISDQKYVYIMSGTRGIDKRRQRYHRTVGERRRTSRILKLLRYGFGKLFYAFRPYGLQQIEVCLYRIAFACELVRLW